MMASKPVTTCDYFPIEIIFTNKEMNEDGTFNAEYPFPNDPYSDPSPPFDCRSKQIYYNPGLNGFFDMVDEHTNGKVNRFFLFTNFKTFFDYLSLQLEYGFPP